MACVSLKRWLVVLDAGGSGHEIPQSIFRVLACFLACLSGLIVILSVIGVGICDKIAFIKDGVFHLRGNVLVLENELTQCVTRDNQQQKRRKKMTENAGIVFIGRKPAMSYVLAIITSLSSSSAKEITLKARGQAITTAVDVAEIARSRFLKDLKVGKISIGTEEMPPREGQNRPRMVSTMEITLNR